MSISKFVLLPAIYMLIVLVPLCGQESQYIINNNYHFPGPKDYNEIELYGISLNQSEALPFEDDVINLQAQNSFVLDETRSIDLLLETIARSVDDSQDSEVYFAIASKYFDKRDYSTSKSYWKEIETFDLSLERRAEMQFKLAYCYLVEKDFQTAFGLFQSVENTNNILSPHASYYAGICAFYLGDRDKALVSFKKVENHRKYNNLVPFYLSQIYFKDEDYIEAIKYAQSRISNAGSNKYLLERILGMSYVALEDYNKALPHLENYAASADKLTENDAYQIGIAHYKLGQYSKAQEYFKELSYQESPIGQMSNFLLASTSIEKGEKKNAQSAFKQAGKLDYFLDIKEESNYLYYKVSADLGDERIAINGLSGINSNSIYYSASQQLLSQLLINSTDTENSINVIENIELKSQEINNTYKVLTYENGLQKLKDGDVEIAIRQFEKALNTNSKSIPNSEIQFRLAQSFQAKGDINTSRKWYESYLENDDHEHRFESHYALSYIEMEDQNYSKAIGQLENALENFNIEEDQKNLFDDVLVRLADLELVNNNYASALEYYELAIRNNAEESDYILYQKSMIYGVNNQIIEKLTSLEKLLKHYPKSNYRDDALFQLAETLVQLGKNNQAYQVYNTIIIEFGNASEYSAISYMRQGLISYNQGDLYAALNSYKQGIDICQDKDEKRRALKAVEDIYLYDLNEANDFFKYQESLTGVQIGDIEKDSIVFAIASDVYKNAEYEKAITKFEEYLKSYSHGFYVLDANYYLAESYLVLKSYSKALEYYKKVLKEENGKYYESALKKSAVISYNYAQDFKTSFELYDKLIDMQNTNPSLENLEAALYSAFIIENKNAVLKYGELVSNHSSVSIESKSAAHFYMAKVFYQRKELDSAYNQFERVSRLSKNNQAAESSYYMAKIHFDQNNLQKAEKQAFLTATEGSNYAIWVSKSIMLIADIYVLKKDYLNATAAYESVIENFKENEDILREAKNKLADLEKLIKTESRISDENDLEFIPIDSTSQNK